MFKKIYFLTGLPGVNIFYDCVEGGCQARQSWGDWFMMRCRQQSQLILLHGEHMIWQMAAISEASW